MEPFRCSSKKKTIQHNRQDPSDWSPLKMHVYASKTRCKSICTDILEIIVRFL